MAPRTLGARPTTDQSDRAQLLRLWSRLRAALGAHDRGSELIELAIALPILLLVISGIMDFGFLFNRYEVLANAAREGARTAAKDPSECVNVSNVVQDYLTGSGLTDSPTVSCGTQSITMPSSLVVNVATVTVTYPTSFLFINVGSINLTAVSSMRIEAAGGS